MNEMVYFLRGRCRRIAIATFLILLLLTCLIPWRYMHSQGLTHHHRLGWKPPKDCGDCVPLEPLPYSRLRPNLLLVLVHAAASRRDEREAMRHTWLSGCQNEHRGPIGYRFVVGGKNISKATANELKKETQEHGDLLILDDVTDTFSSLTLRTLRMLEAAASFPEPFEYVLKVDDDSYVDVLRVASELHKRSLRGRLYWGEMIAWSIGTRGRNGETRYHVCDMYMPYAYGGGYVLSGDLVRLIADNAAHLKLYTNEDVSLASWLVPYNIERVHDTRFDVGQKSRGCKDPYLISHKVSVEKMESYFTSYKLEGTYCSWRNYVSSGRGYMYHWDKLTSQKFKHSGIYP